MPELLLRVSNETLDGTVVLAVAGELDLHTVPTLLSAVDAALEAGAVVVSMDAAEVTFADSSATNGLLRAQAAAAGRGATFELTRVSDQMERTLSLAGLSEVFAPPD
jgi:anti-sigma B factor antagonist